MAAISPQAIKELRERTQAGMSDCKKALVDAEGDMEKAVDIILKAGKAKSVKKAGAIATEGEVRTSVAADKRAATIIEVNIQTDFSARSDQFKTFVGEALALAETAPLGTSLDALTLGGKPVADVVTELSAKIGEKILVRRWDRAEVPAGKSGFAAAYTHFSGNIGAVLVLETASDAISAHIEVAKFAEEIAMHIAAASPSPLVLTRSEVAPELIEKQREIAIGQLREDPKPKPEAAWPKIIEGKLNKWFTDISLLEQESVVSPGNTVEKLRAATEKAVGGSVKILRFARYERGEGIEKAEKDDFATEVMKAAGQA